jgi:methylthioribulose-1-phosphate dehydratase
VGLDPAREIVRTASILAAHGWAPAGSGNYSCRRADGAIAITVSGAHKARLTTRDVMWLGPSGQPMDHRRPSAETPLHLMLYRLYPDTQAVLHTHSMAVVAMTRLLKARQALRLAGYELLKAFPGVDTHDCAVDLPIFDNSQDMVALASEVEAALTARSAPAFLVRGHGLYGWGASLDEALCVVEAAETLIACELDLIGREDRR